MAAPSPHLWAFFHPGDLPAFAAAPEDAATKDRILLLAKYAMQNGVSFIEMVRAKQAGNPEYAFLTLGGTDNVFFRWALFATGCGISVDEPPPLGFVPPAPQPVQPQPQQYLPPQQMYPQQQPYGQQQAMHYQHPIHYQQPHMQHMQPPMAMQPQIATQQQQQPARPTPPAIPPDVAGGFSQVLDALTGSKDSIKASQGWFMACAPYAAGMAYMMASRASTTPEFEKLLHLIYLANDILFKAFTQQQQQQQQDGQQQQADAAASFPAMCAAFAPALGVMLAAAQVAAASSSNEAGREKLSKMLAFWQDKGLFDAQTMARLHHEMAAGNPTAALLANYPPAAAAAIPQEQQQQQQQPQAAARGGWGPVPAAAAAAGYPPQVAAPPQAASGWGPPPAAAAAAAPAAPSSSGWGPPVGMQQAQQQQQQPGWPPVSPAGIPPAGIPPAGTPWGGYPGGQPAMQYPPGTVLPPGGPVPGVPPGALPGVPYPGVAPVPPGAYPPQSMGMGGPPSAAPPAAPPPGLPPQAPPQPEPEPQPEPVSSFNFPPGLIPQLVRDKSKYSEPYAPMDPVEIDRAGLPPPPEKDAYLKSRLSKFMLEVRDYKPGSSRADLEESRAAARAQQGLEPDSDEELALGSSGSRLARRKALGLGAGGAEGRRARRTVAAGMADDGSYVGPGGGRGERLGLGAHSQADSATARLGDVYSSYRKLRSSSYHEMIVRGGGVSNMAKGGR